MRWLIDEMLPAVADHLQQLGHDALGVAAAGLAETDDAVLFAAAVEQDRVVVTENFGDFSQILTQRSAAEKPCVPVVFVRKRNFPRGGALAPHLADHFHRWTTANPGPYPGPIGRDG